MGEHDLPDDVMLSKAAAGARRLLKHLSEPSESGTNAAPAAGIDELEEAVRSLRQLANLLDKESASQ